MSSSDAFIGHFYAELSKIEEQLNALKNESLNEKESDLEKRQRLSSDYEKISKQTEILQKYFTDNSKFITQYEIRKAQEHLTKLNKHAQEKRDELFPKKKFGFKSKQNMTSLASAIETATTSTKNDETRRIGGANDETNDDEATSLAFSSLQNTCTLKDLNGVRKHLSGEEIDNKDILIMNVSDSFIILMGNPSCVQIKYAKNCTILCGPVSGSVFIANCEHCRIVLGCHQLRIHESHFVDFYIHVGSRAIIEYCQDVHFAPYAWSFADDHVCFKRAGFDRAKLNWQSIDDFNWLVTDQQSPNWSYLDEQKRKRWRTDESGETHET